MAQAKKPPSSSSRWESTPQKIWQEILKEFLTVIFRNAAKEGRFLTPEGALWELDEFLAKISDSQKRRLDVNARDGEDPKAQRLQLPLLSGIAVTRKAYQFAVDLCFRTYSFSEFEKGRPKLTKADLEPILALREKGLTWSQVAKKLGLPHSTSDEVRRSTDMLRKRVKAAKSRDAVS